MHSILVISVYLLKQLATGLSDSAYLIQMWGDYERMTQWIRSTFLLVILYQLVILSNFIILTLSTPVGVILQSSVNQ